MDARDVRQLVEQDRWAMVSGESGNGPFVLRYRQPILMPPAVTGYPKCVRVVWAYAAQGTLALPGPQHAEEMGTFENRLVTAWEHDVAAALVAVLTFDGARQWVFYSPDVRECESRLSDMSQGTQPYPIELDAFDDPTWNYLRNEIIRDRADA